MAAASVFSICRSWPGKGKKHKLSPTSPRGPSHFGAWRNPKRQCSPGSAVVCLGPSGVHVTWHHFRLWQLISCKLQCVVIWAAQRRACSCHAPSRGGGGATLVVGRGSVPFADPTPNPTPPLWGIMCACALHNMLEQYMGKRSFLGPMEASGLLVVTPGWLLLLPCGLSMADVIS